MGKTITTGLFAARPAFIFVEKGPVLEHFSQNSHFFSYTNKIIYTKYHNSFKQRFARFAFIKKPQKT
jgi:hypothetical protein